MKIIHSSGSRKMAKARATLKEGQGRIKINNQDINNWNPEFMRMKILEPVMLAKDAAQKIDISIRVHGGGIVGQAEAVRLAIAKGLMEYNPKLRQEFLEYDRHLVVADVRQREARKPNTHGNARGKVQKSYR